MFQKQRDCLVEAASAVREAALTGITKSGGGNPRHQQHAGHEIPQFSEIFPGRVLMMVIDVVQGGHVQESSRGKGTEGSGEQEAGLCLQVLGEQGAHTDAERRHAGKETSQADYQEEGQLTAVENDGQGETFGSLVGQNGEEKH